MTDIYETQPHKRLRLAVESRLAVSKEPLRDVKKLAIDWRNTYPGNRSNNCQ